MARWSEPKGKISASGEEISPFVRQQAAPGQEGHVTQQLITNLYVFVLAGFVGFEVIRRVSRLLHTPLMSLTNALDAIAVVGAIVIAGERKSTLATVLGTLAVAASMSNIVGGFLITDRMLRMFKAGKSKKP
jgi:NAD(P) transhydrogenase subunit alpha